MNWDREVDLLVAGAGAGGLSAALIAACRGLDVLVCEKGAQVGGTAATSAGTLWIPDNAPSRRAGFSDSAGEARRYLDALIPSRAKRDAREVYLASGPAAIDYVMSSSDVQFAAAGRHPDYHSDLPGAAIAGRAIVPVPFDGRKLGADFAKVRPPIPEFLLFGGMMVSKADIAQLLQRFRSPASFLYAAKLFARFLVDRLRYPRGTRLVMGNALVARLYYSLLRRRVPVLTHTPLIELILEEGAVVGGKILECGREIRVRARRGVVLATGGYANNQTLRRKFMPAATIHSFGSANHQGDGITLALQAGAVLDGNGAFYTPVSITRRQGGGTGLFPHLLLDRAKPGILAVNAAGKRFVNEALSYHDFVLAMFQTNALARAIPAFLICTAEFVERYGLGIIYPGTRDLRPFEKNGYIRSAGSIQELAARIEVDPVGLTATVAAFNQYAASGVDPDFHRGATEFNRFNGDPSHGPNPCLGPLRKPPFIALAVWPAEIACSAGLATDVDARVLRAGGEPIHGLYACGNDMASIMEGSYPGPGTTLGPALTFAYRAAMHAAAGTGAGQEGGASAERSRQTTDERASI
jgi:succinate dehydrogenase/fumarate reductase flavoprotein subunit